uniref:phosphatidate phosphatase n=1 Tax=Amphiprion ocellaris TaxID=80972 RepID=A0AAQ5Y5R2_AMPOC
MAEGRSGEHSLVGKEHLHPSLWSQTMNIVGQLAETVFVTVKELYRGLNPATLTGGIDVIVVRQPDGSFQCSPFHVRFGKLGVLRSKEKIVDIEINGESVDLHMKLGDNGEAFFVEQNENMEVPAHLCTSPIPLEGHEDLEETTEGSSIIARRKKRRRKRIRSDNHLREDANSSSDERERERECERETDQAQLESPALEELTTPLQKFISTINSLTYSFVFKAMSPARTLESYLRIFVDAVSFVIPLIHDFLFISLFDFLFPSSVFYSRPSSPKSDSELLVKSQESSEPQIQWNWGGFPTVWQHTHTLTLRDDFKVYLCCVKTVDLSFHDDALSQTSHSASHSCVNQRRHQWSCRSSLIWASVFTYQYVTGKRNHHLGPTDIYLDDLTTLDPEVAALYFPKSEAEGAFQQGAEQGSFSGSQSPQSVGSGAMDSGTEYLSDSTSYSMDVSMSLCGQEGDTSQITKEKFMEHLVTYQDFTNNPGIIEDPSLVICINSNYYNWAVAAPMVLSMTTFQKNLPKSTIERLVKDKMPKKSGRWWFSWRRRDMDSQVESLIATLDDIDSDEAAGLGRKAIIPSGLSTETLNAAQSISQMYRKSLRLTSEQIEHLNLREGANKVVFSVTTQYQGTCRCEAAIYLWNWDDRVIISDIDGTITKSDALGHILPQFGKDWTHKGIAKLYHKIHQNGYKFLYCSARAIGMAAITKDYLQWVNDKGTVLPKGPVLLAPSSLFSALHREVIEKKPEVFKVACLSDIRDLFNPQRQPFYAAFGNRTNDAYAYKQVGVSETKIFTVNPKGELIQEKTKGNKSSYCHLGELVEHFFPVLAVEGRASFALDCPDYSSFSYWKEPLPEVDLDALL